MNNMKYLGYVIESAGIHIAPDKVQILKIWPIPQNIHELRIFLGLVNFFRRFILSFDHMAWPLNQLTKGNEKAVFKWTSTQQQAFEQFNHKLCTAPVLALPNLHQPFENKILSSSITSYVLHQYLHYLICINPLRLIHTHRTMP